MSGKHIVIGGGIVGISIAFELADRGEKVVVLERDEPGKQASWAGVGILPPGAVSAGEDPIDRLRALSHRLHAEWAERLRSETGIDTGFRRCGGLYLARTAGEAATLVGTFAWWREQGIEVNELTPSELLVIEPRLESIASSLHRRGIWSLPDECQLRTPRHMRALVEVCKRRGVEFLTHCEALELEHDTNRITGVKTSAGLVQGDDYCVAAGPWVRQLLEPLGLPTGVLPIRGQVILFHHGEHLLTRIVNEGHRYLLPRDDGRILVGSNEEEVGYEVATTPEVVNELQEWAYTFLPRLQEAEIERTWAGLRPASFDGLPYIGRLPDYSNCYVAAGHFRAGIHLSCGTAQVIADLMLTGRTSIDLDPLRPGRG